MQRFGLLNRHDEGHRRLNVLVTRAKRANWVVTSLRPNDVVAGPTTSRGVQGFQRYLAYAAGGATVDAVQPAAEPDSDFEVFVAERLRAHGYEVVHQVGVDRFRIDLGVRHPSYPVGYLAGVECDGAAFHSHYTVRDRDRIRQGVLEGLGWRIWRVWSTDWFNNPERETGRLLSWLDGLRTQAEARYGGAGAPVVEPAPELQPAALAPPSASIEAEDSAAPLTASVAVEPAGRRLSTPDGCVFYEDPAFPGLFEVWDERVLGTVERTGGPVGAAKLFGGGQVVAPKPQYVATWPGGRAVTDDLYRAVRKVADAARTPEPA